MSKRQCGGGRLLRPLQTLVRNAAILLIVFPSAAISQTSDFLIVRNTRNLVVYDSFQQSVGAGQIPIRPFQPMRILAQRDVLGDGLTPCTTVDVDGETMYLLRDETGKLAGWKNFGVVRTYARKVYIGDTIAVLRSGRISWKDASGQRRVVLRFGDRCIRYFEHDGAFYARKLGSGDAFGWIDLPLPDQGRWWRIERSASPTANLSPMITDRLLSKVKQTNETFVQIYETLGKETGRQLAPPQWSVEYGVKGISLTLRPESAVRFYPKSIGELAAILQAYVAGTGYTVQMIRNRIEVKMP